MSRKIIVSILTVCLLLLATSFQNLEIQNVEAEELSNQMSGKTVGNDFDSQKVPYLLITEIVPDSVNIGSADGYEFIEIYNNSIKAINLKDYKIHYRYPKKASKEDIVMPAVKEDIELASGDTFVYWITNSHNQDKTVEDFNQHYGVQLVENEDIVKVNSSGLANDSERGIAIATNVGEDVAVAFYNDDLQNLDTAEDKGILYTYPRTPNDNMMKKYRSKTDFATPGSLLPLQVPDQKVQLSEDDYKPNIQDLTNTEEFNVEQDDLTLSFNVFDDQLIKTTRLYYKTDKDSTYHTVDLSKKSGSSIYKYIFPSVDLIGKSYLEYYVLASDGTNTVESPKQKVNVMQDKIPEGISLNVDDNTVLSQNALIKAFHSKDNSQTTLTLDNKDVTGKTSYTLDNKAYYVVDVNKVDRYFENGITIGNEPLFIFHNKITEYTTLKVPVDPRYFTKGEKTTIAIRAGTKKTPFDEGSVENRDDFVVKNIRLILSDGTVIQDPAYTDSTKEIKMGDSKGANPVIKSSFIIPEEKFTAKAYKWDTKSAKDGKHIVVAKNNKETVKANILVDNTAPLINPSIKAGQLYKGKFTINAEIKDNYSGVQNVTTTLDGEQITLPMNTSSATLAPGEHTLIIKAIDHAGNESKKTTKFKVVEEQPYVPKLVTPIDYAKEVSLAPKIKVAVSDPTGDELDISFNRAYQYQADQVKHMQIFENSTDNEPPKSIISEGEKVITNVDKLTKVDNQYITTTGTDRYPYQRFEVTLDNEVDNDDEIEVNWEGKSVIGRRVSMYIWNFDKNKWEVQEWKIADNSKNFKLNAKVKGANYIRNHKVQVLIQDEIASTNQFNYSFVWMSDTQYYSKSYPLIYQQMTQWIASQKDSMNIKYVFHTGDIVDNSTKSGQWVNADLAMKTLDTANVPYGVLAGNHDVNHIEYDYKKFDKYFGEKRFADRDYYGGSYQNNRGHYDLISEKGNDFIMLYLGWGIDDDSLAWVNQILKKYPDRKAILNFHEYLLASGERSSVGDIIFNKVVKPNNNVIAVLSGHYFGSATLVDNMDDNNDGITDRKVYQMLSDYSGAPDGGQGFMRILQVNPIENKIYVKTYSPYLNQYNYYNSTDYPGKDEFVIETDLTPKEKVVATDKLLVNVYTNDEIGKVTGVQNNKAAGVVWGNLENDKTYHWYAEVTDAYQGKVHSPIWSLQTVKKGDGFKDYNVTVKEPNGHVYEQKTIQDNEIMPEPKKSGYTFTGWYADSNLKKEFDFDTMLKKETTVYASFTKNPSPVKGLAASSSAYDSIILKWQQVADADGYILYRSESRNGKYTQIATNQKKSNVQFIDQKLTTGKQYFYKVKAYKKKDSIIIYSTDSSSISAKPKLSKPAKFAIDNFSGKSIKLSWEMTNGATGYEIYRGDHKSMHNSNIVTIKSGKTNYYIEKRVKAGKSYDYKVRAYRTVNGKKVYSDFSIIKTFKFK
ncbi:InlB B-repeat-containing protein [Rummeliibacillus sp. NPDC094406]|uniref:InlB B-repeat-containing protein n=1 Tax=Rummeliibacillus sp. NPDC094406 TaxID=3364511 RepID=UPI00382E18EE